MLFPLHHYTHNHINQKDYEGFKVLHSKKWMKWLDKSMIYIGLISPLMATPQIIDIFANQDAGRVSGFSWGAYTILQFFWLAYGAAHKSKPLIVSAIAWIIVDLIIVIGVVIY